MAGGTWTSQNKVRPGVYIRFRSAADTAIAVRDGSVVAICEPMSWGAVGQVVSISAGEDTTPYCGYDITNPKAAFLREIFKGSNRTGAPSQVLLYRPSANSASQASATTGALTATAIYPGARGNDISIVITEIAEDEGTFNVFTVVDGAVVDTQVAAEADELTANAWVGFSGTGALTATTGEALSGGSDGTVQSAAYTAFLTAIEPYKFDVLIYDGSDTSVSSAYIAFAKQQADDYGKYFQVVAAGLTNPDSRFVINVANGVKLSDGSVINANQATWWVGGVSAGAMYNQSLTYARYPDAVDVDAPMTNEEIISALSAGELVLSAEDGEVKIEQDINSLVTYTVDIGKAFSKNRVMRLCNTIANNIYQQFSDNFIGVINNDETGRSLLKSAIVGYLLEVEGAGGIQNFSADDVSVEAGEDIDSVVVNIGIQSLDAVEKIYMTVTVS